MLGNFKNKITEYINVRVEELRLEVFERIVNVVGYAIFSLLAAVLILISFVFLGFSLATYLGTVMDNVALGYLSTFGVFILLGVLLLIFSKPFIRFISSKLIRVMTKKHKDSLD